MLFQPIKIKNYTIKNRLVMPPMCMYSADEEGFSNTFHTVHYGTRAMGGVSIVIQEATAISKEGRISVHDLGIWRDEHIVGLKEIVKAIRDLGAIPGIQINHAGRKSKTEKPFAPSAIPFSDDYELPHEMTEQDIKKVISDFKEAARRADEAGYDLLEIHGAHGYLIFEFLSPISNKRKDKYGDGKIFLKEVIEAINEVWPKEKILALRVSAYEYTSEGVTPESISEIINFVKHLGLDLIDVSSGGNVLVRMKPYPGYQLGFAQTVKALTKLPVIGGGLITDLKMASYAVETHQADMIFLGRALLHNPYLVINEATQFKEDFEYPKQYIRGKK